MPQRPMAIGLFVCEKTIVEENTRNLSFINCLTRLHVNKTPSSPYRFDVWAALTDGQGEVSVDLLVLEHSHE